MKAPARMTPERDRLQLSFIYQRIGGINTDLVEFDAAIAAYKKSLEISPENADARVALGDLYLRRGQQAEALAEYARVAATHPDNALPHYRLADASLQMGDFTAAAAGAARALKLDHQLRKARYVNGVSLVRMGRSEEGQRELQEYRKQEADAQAEINNFREAAATLQELLEKGISDDFLVYRSLARAHEGLKDEKAGQKSSALYIRQLDAVLEKELQ